MLSIVLPFSLNDGVNPSVFIRSLAPSYNASLGSDASIAKSTAWLTIANIHSAGISETSCAQVFWTLASSFEITVVHSSIILSASY